MEVASFVNAPRWGCSRSISAILFCSSMFFCRLFICFVVLCCALSVCRWPCRPCWGSTWTPNWNERNCHEKWAGDGRSAHSDQIQAADCKQQLHATTGKLLTRGSCMFLYPWTMNQDQTRSNKIKLSHFNQPTNPQPPCQDRLNSTYIILYIIEESAGSSLHEVTYIEMYNEIIWWWRHMTESYMRTSKPHIETAFGPTALANPMPILRRFTRRRRTLCLDTATALVLCSRLHHVASCSPVYRQ